LSLLLLMYCITFIDLCMLHPWDEANLVIVTKWSYDLSDVLLDLVCHYFI
jgi:hypothetical protein